MSYTKFPECNKKKKITAHTKNEENHILSEKKINGRYHYNKPETSDKDFDAAILKILQLPLCVLLTYMKK